MMDFTAHPEHTPRATGDPDYVPYWAKGEFARKGGYTYTTESGYTIRAGQLAGYREPAPRALQAERELPPVPRAVRALPPVPKAARALDAVQSLLTIHKTREERLVLCAKYGVDPAIFTGAPNPGVAAMRLANALRRAGV
jgi:hypothetical protein